MWALLGGLVVALILVFVLEMVSHLVYPPPAGLDFNDTNAVLAYMKEIPTGALVLVLIGHFIALLVGCVVGLLIANAEKRIAYGVTVAFIGLVGMNLTMIPHPSWFIPAEFAAIALALFISLKVVRPKH